MWIGEHRKGLAEAELAIKLAPNFAGAYAYLVHCLNFLGRPEEAIPTYSDRALRLDPLGSSMWLYQGAASTCRLAGRYEDGVKMAKKDPLPLAQQYHGRIVPARELRGLGP